MKQSMKKESKSNREYIRLVIGYVCFCLVVLIIVAVMLSRYISKNNAAQINNILSLMSEKVNTSFEMMVDYITEAADLVSAQKEISFEENYEELQQTLKDMPYFSIGMLSTDGTVYGTPGEQMDIEKQGFVEAANSFDTIYISEPYRSSVTGSNMITIFAPVYHGGEHVGSIFVTYYLATIQDLAYTNILSNETAVFLMNPYSGNFVSCSEDGDNPPGTWSNIRLIKNDIECFNGYDYDKWLDDMKNASDNNIINFRQNGIAYSQAFVNITGMNNWELVIRIPLAELSNTMQQYSISVAVCAALLILATLFLAASLYRGEHSKTEVLQSISNKDPLTKILNRRGFESALKKIFANKAELGRSTYMFVDVDLFKNVNDQYGHDVGDYVLCAVASILEEAFKEVGVVGRVGGDEFNVFVYEPLSNEDIDARLAQVKIKLNDLILPDDTPLPISFSGGLAVYPQDAKALNELIACADEALYHVKENGRKHHFWYSDLKK